jgi:hypothetical protein
MDDQVDDESALRRPGSSCLLRRAAMIAALAVTALLAAACGGGGSHASAASPTGGQSIAQAVASYAACIRSHGEPNLYFSRQTGTPAPPASGEMAVLFVDGYVAEFNPNSPQFRSAQKTCQHLMPGGDPSTGETHQQFLHWLKAAVCMRTHGYPNWPDPSANANGFTVPAGVDANSTQFQAAAKTCRVPVPPGG